MHTNRAITTKIKKIYNLAISIIALWSFLFNIISYNVIWAETCMPHNEKQTSHLRPPAAEISDRLAIDLPIKAELFTLEELKKIYLTIFAEDISFNGSEIHCLLAVLFGTPLFFGEQKLVPKEVIIYMKMAYGRFSAFVPEKPNWYDANFDLFNTWRSLAALSDSEYETLFDWLKWKTVGSKKRRRVQYHYLKTREAPVRIHKKLRNMLDMERIFGRVLLDENYHPPICRVVLHRLLDIDQSAFNYDTSQRFAEDINRTMTSNQQRAGAVFHRLKSLANFLNIILTGGPKTGMANYADPAGATSSEFGTYIVARVFVNDVPIEGFFYICPSEKSERMSRDVINKAIEEGIAVGIEAEEITDRIFSYKSFQAFFKALLALTQVDQHSKGKRLLNRPRIHISPAEKKAAAVLRHSLQEYRRFLAVEQAA